jgi:hypothetical protein
VQKKENEKYVNNQLLTQNTLPINLKPTLFTQNTNLGGGGVKAYYRSKTLPLSFFVGTKKTTTNAPMNNQRHLSYKRGKVKSALTLLTTFVLFVLFSFTFSSCRDCGKKGADLTGRDDNANNTDKSKEMPKEILLKEEEESKKLLENVAGLVVEICYAFGKADDAYKNNNTEEIKKQRDEAKRLATQVREVAQKQEVVKAASGLSNENTKNNALAIIEVLLVRAEGYEAFAEFLMAKAAYKKAGGDPGASKTELDNVVKDEKSAGANKKKLAQELINAKKAGQDASIKWKSCKETYAGSRVIGIAMDAWNKVCMGTYGLTQNESEHKFG